MHGAVSTRNLLVKKENFWTYWCIASWLLLSMSSITLDAFLKPSAE